MLCEVNSHGDQPRELHAVFVVGAQGTDLVAEGQVQVCKVTQVVFFEISLDMVLDFVTLKFVIILIFPIVSRRLNFLR